MYGSTLTVVNDWLVLRSTHSMSCGAQGRDGSRRARADADARHCGNGRAARGGAPTGLQLRGSGSVWVPLCGCVQCACV